MAQVYLEVMLVIILVETVEMELLSQSQAQQFIMLAGVVVIMFLMLVTVV